MKQARSALDIDPKHPAPPSRLARLSAVSGPRRISSLREAPRLDDFEEPDLELVAMTENIVRRTPIEAELDRARSALEEREREVESLDRQVEELRSEVARLVGELRLKQAELDELGSLLLPSIVPPREARPSARECSPTDAPQALSYPDVYPMLSNLCVHRSESDSSSGFTDSEAPTSQRKRAPRHEYALELEFSGESEFYAGITQDISQGGIFIATYRVYPVNTRLELSFELPGGIKVEARGEVRWVREMASGDARPGMGVAFTELSGDAFLAIQDFCAKRAPLYLDI